ncbi:MAG: hypothetical protein D6775_01905 [Caldilineae bacterium]|nr:MAG: hypothetical protein D6775_01905 [Caldilineae bacterium]
MYDPLLALLIGLAVLAVAAWLLWPQKGLLHRWQRARQYSARVMQEDALKHIHRAERGGYRATVQSVAGDLQITVDDAARLLAEMEQAGLISRTDGDIHLTAEGRESALHIIRAHRLWERYLADETGFAEEEWHRQAEQLEHTLLPTEADALSARLGNPTHDPHGDPIPTAEGKLVAHGGVPILALEEGMSARVVHLEDEPEVVYAQLVAEGIAPGQRVQLLEKTPQRVRFWCDGNEHVLAPALAANISVVPLLPSQAPEPPQPGESLADLKIGEEGEVVRISRACRGSERRRLMDLGILPGARIRPVFSSPAGDPVAYLVRDTLIALRSEQAKMIGVRRIPVPEEQPV